MDGLADLQLRYYYDSDCSACIKWFWFPGSQVEFAYDPSVFRSCVIDTYSGSTTLVTIVRPELQILPAGIPISESMNWGAFPATGYSAIWGCSPDCASGADYKEYLAFRMPRPIDTLYGWMQVSDRGRTIHEYRVSKDVADLVTGYSGDTIPCTPTTPTSLVHDFGEDIVTLEWEPVDETVGCRVNILNASTGAAQNFIVSDFEARIFELPATAIDTGNYVWTVQCACSLSPLVATPVSTPANFRISCNEPAGLTETWNSFWGTMKFDWDDAGEPGAPNYDYIFKLKRVGLPFFPYGISKDVENSTYTLDGSSFAAGLMYKWRVKSRCFGGNESSFSPWRTFSFPLVPEPSGVSEDYEALVKISRQRDYFEIKSPYDINKVTLYDMAGRQLMNSKYAGELIVQWEVPELNSGIYLLNIQGSFTSHTIKFWVD